MISSEKLLQKFFFASLIIWKLLMVYCAFYTFNIHKGVCRNACNVLSFILGGLVVPLGLFLCLLVTDLSQVFLYTWVIYSIVVAFANLKPWRKLCCCCCCECKRNCPTATKFIQGFSSSSLSLFWSELLAFSYRCPPQTNRRRQKTPVTKTKNVLFWDFFIGTIFLAFFVLIWCPNGHNCYHVFRI